MADVSLNYKSQEFEENPTLITWVQIFLIHLLKSKSKLNEWQQNYLRELETNVLIDVYKYLFDEEILDDINKEKWAISFLQEAEKKLCEMTKDEFSTLIHVTISEKVKYERIIEVIKRFKIMISSQLH